jgi:hypothetical protein
VLGGAYVVVDVGPGNLAKQVHRRYQKASDRRSRWELARAGIDFARYLATLEHLIDHARAGGGDEAGKVADEAERFLESIRSAVSPDPRHHTFEEPHSLEPVPAFRWQAADFAQRRERSFELVRKLAALVDPVPDLGSAFRTGTGASAEMGTGTSRINGSSAAS